MKGKFVHLHLHTEYSLLDGFTRINTLFERVKALGMDAVAITDHGVMFGVVQFYKKAIEKGVHPIIGCEVYMAPRSMKDKKGSADRDQGHLVLLVENEIGYKNLIHLVSMGFLEGFYYKPRIDYDLLSKHSEGLICLSACLAGDIQQALIEDRYEDAKALAVRLHGIFGKDRFYLELQDHGIPLQKKVNSQLVRLSKETKIPLVATNDVHYTEKEDHQVHDVLLCIQTGKLVDDEKRLRFPSDEFYLKSPEQMEALFPYAPEAIENTLKISKMCKYKFDFEARHLPSFPLEDGETAKEKLRQLCEEGLEKRYESLDENLKERLDFELDIIFQMGFEDYFLITWDFIKYAKDRNIIVGPGRGSCGGSLVAYTLFITDVDPIKYDLIFERFLNPERITMPDIDIDFEDERRQEVIDYVVEKYGKDHVAQIITFGTMAARAAVRDVGRVVDISYQETDRIAKAIPFQLGMTIEKALKISPRLKELCSQSKRAEQVIATAQKVEGVPRHASTHAAGVVISQKPVDHYVPLYVHDGNVSTQFPMGTLEKLGLLKMDFLGLRNLTVIKDTLALIRYGKRDAPDFSKMEMDDEAVYKMISTGETLGVFQLESSGMRRFMKELKPTALEDLIAGISLYRPGPMDSIPKYIYNKNHPQNITYSHPKLKNILSVSYGCLVYQEQVMQIVRELAGYTYGRSDLVRRAMSKKEMDVMERERQHFVHGKLDEKGNVEVEGCVRRGIPEKIAEEVFNDMVDFARYAFNKSHAAGYAIIAYQTAYLKVHHPVAFMAALMTSVMGNQSKLAQYIQDCRRMGIDVLAPSVNESYRKFSVSGNKIRFGLQAVKNVGTGVIRSIVKNRPKTGYKDFLDFCERMDSRELNRKAVESLIKAGAFDDMNSYRSRLLAVYEKIIEGVQKESRNNVAGQISLFSDDALSKNGMFHTENMPHVAPFKTKIKLSFEKEMLGIYLSGHPLSEYKKLMESIRTTDISELYEAQEEGELYKRDNEMVTLPGMIAKVNEKMTRNQSRMAFLNLEDLAGNIEVLVFPKIYKRYRAFIKEDGFIVVHGRLNVKEDELPKIVVEKIEPLDREGPLQNDLDEENDKEKDTKDGNKKLFLKVAVMDAATENSLKSILIKHKGLIPVVLYVEAQKKKFKTAPHLWVNGEEEVLKALKTFLGSENVVLR